jgi:hypothetical protein
MNKLIKNWKEEVVFTKDDILDLKSKGLCLTSAFYNGKIVDFVNDLVKLPISNIETLYYKDHTKYEKTISELKEAIGKLYTMGRYIDHYYIAKKNAKSVSELTNGSGNKSFGDHLANLLGPVHQLCSHFEDDEFNWFKMTDPKLNVHKNSLARQVLKQTEICAEFCINFAQNYYHP